MGEVKPKERGRAREYALQMLYLALMSDTPAKEAAETFWKGRKRPDEELAAFAESLLEGALADIAESDRLISQFLKETWSFDRLGEMEKDILRLASYELLTLKTPYYAVFDDYVSLAYRYTDSKAASFVNAVLENMKARFISVDSSGQ